jgi:predicted NUDIX family NTP pyrophosphohydrolase
MVRRSAGLLLWRSGPDGTEVLLGHPGGPLFAGKDSWTIPKGEYEQGEPALAAAHREFAEEVGVAPPEGECVPLGEVTLRSGKRVLVWALEGDLDVSEIHSNSFEMQWPPRSGRVQQFPELDRAQWFALVKATAKIFPAQAPYLDRLADHLAGPRPDRDP